MLVKITRATGIRQVINYSLGKLKDDWKVTFNAFTLDMTKVLQATEIIKTRLPYLHQENKLISYSPPSLDKAKEDSGEGETEEAAATSARRSNIRTGIQVTISRKPFEVADLAGYQKPKPRQFMQPIPPASRAKKDAEEKEAAELALKDAELKKRRSSKNKKRAEQKKLKKEATHDQEEYSEPLEQS